MRGLKLTPLGETVRDVGAALLGIPFLYVFVLAMVAIGDGLGVQ